MTDNKKHYCFLDKYRQCDDRCKWFNSIGDDEGNDDMDCSFIYHFNQFIDAIDDLGKGR